MKLSIRHRLRRRDFVKYLGSAALALPSLELFEGEVRAQAVPKKAKFAIFLYTNDGVNNKNFWPTSPDPTSSVTLGVFKAKAEGGVGARNYKDKMLVLGPKLASPGVPAADAGLTYNTKPAQHRANICITGSAVNLPLNADQFTVNNKIDGPSLDFVLGTTLQTDPASATPFPFLNFGIHPIGGDTPSEINFDNSGQPIARMTSADEVMKRVFGGMTGGAGSPDAVAGLRKHTAVTDFLNQRFATLRNELSPYDKQIIDHHLTSLRAYEDRTARLLMSQANPDALCKGPAADKILTDETSLRTGADTQFLAPFFLQSVVIAFACNLTRVASVTFGYPGGGGEGGLRMPWLGFTDAQHSVSHHGNTEDKLRKYGAMNKWTAEQVVFLLDQLATIPLASGGTLLDQTVVYYFNRHGDGNGHTNFALPNVLLGGAGGYFKMGQALALDKTGPTRVLLSVAHSMGVMLPTFGKGMHAETTELLDIKA